MIRFRHQDDEQRYLKLRSQIYRRVAAALPPDLFTELMANFGKLELLLQLEGVRQGVAAHALAMLIDEKSGDHSVERLRAFQIHAHVYGSSDTPLSTTEKVWLERLELPPDLNARSVFDAAPMRFAPHVVAVPEAARRPPAETGSRFMETLPAELLAKLAPAAADDNEVDEEFVRDLFRSASTLSPPELTDDQIDNDLPEAPERPNAPSVPVDVLNLNDASPDFLDRLRSTLLHAKESGWTPESWTDLVMHLHRDMGADAGFIDIQLCTEMGRTMLDQVGLLHLRPGQYFEGTLSEEVDEGASDRHERDLS